MQADQADQVGQSDAIAVARNLFKNGKGAAKRLRADALPIPSIIAEIKRGCRHMGNAVNSQLRFLVGFVLRGLMVANQLVPTSAWRSSRRASEPLHLVMQE